MLAIVALAGLKFDDVILDIRRELQHFAFRLEEARALDGCQVVVDFKIRWIVDLDSAVLLNRHARKQD